MAEINDQATNPQGAQLIPPDNSSYSGATIPPTPAPTVPPAPTAPVTPPALPAATSTMSAPATPAQPKTKQEWFQHLIKMATPSQPVITTNPDGSQTTTDAKTPTSAAQLVLMGALSGMMAKNSYRQGAYGPVLDSQAGAADAFAAGQKTGEAWRQAPQKLSDDMIARRMSTVAANVAAAHNYAAMQQAQFSATKEGAEAEAAQSKILQNTADENNATIGASADAYDQALTDKDAPKARLVKNATFEELMNGPFKSKMTQQLMVQDGTRSAYDPETGRTKIVPTFSLYNPDVDIKLNKDAVDRAAKINPQFEGMYEISGGNVKMNLTRYATVTHQINSVNHAEDTLQSLADSKDDLAKTLGISGNVEGKLAGVVRSNPSAMKSLLEFENATAHGGNTADQLNRLLQSDGGDAIFKALGTDRDKVTDYIESYNNRLASARKLAEQGGMGEKAPAAQDQVNKLVDSIKTNPDLSDADRKGVMVDVPTADKDGVVHMTQGQVEKTVARMDSVISNNKGIAERNALANGDPVQMQKTASNVIEGDVNDLTKIASMRGNARLNVFNALHDEAVVRNLDPTDYSEAATQAKADAQKSYSAAGKIGQQIASFRTFLGHEVEATDANETWKRMNSPLLNKPMSWIATNASNDPTYIRLKTALGAPAKEYMSFLNANRAEHESDIKQMDTVLDVNSTPLQIDTALRELAKTADFRLGSLGKGYQATVGANFTGLLDPSSKAALDKLVGPSATSPKVAVTLPRGWSNGKAQTMTDANMARMYVQAAGNDKAAAIALAKKNGWTLNIQ
jgi:hypothetical protein